jgi:hypothetical protein
MSVEDDLQGRPQMPALISGEGRGGLRVALRQRSCMVLVIGLLLVVPTAGMAQTVTRTFDDLRAESHHGETVYVTDLAGATTKGRILRISANSIALIVKDQTREWPASEVTWITQRRGSAGRGALIGLAVGAVIGPTLIAWDSGGDDYVLFFAPFSAGLGGGIGAAIGAAMRPERVLYAAGRRSTTVLVTPRVAPGVVEWRAQVGF